MTEQDFLGLLREGPEDEVLRLAYADWLEERNDLRAGFLRLEAQLARLPETSPDHEALRHELAQLAARVDVRWRADVCRVYVESGPAYRHPQRCPLNVAGPFYTRGECLACEAPEHEAPDLLAPLANGNYTTYFVRQPRTAAEVDRACRAAQVCCVDDLRYGGTDPKIITRLGNDPHFCDYLLDEDSPTVVPAMNERPAVPEAQDTGAGNDP
jgi:uncharacterized protein (TIGR02996 family)